MARSYFNRAQGILEVDLKQFILGLQAIWWRALLFCLAFALAGTLYSRVTYVPTYTSNTTFVVSNKTVDLSGDTDSLTLSDISASTALANTFKYVLLSDEAMRSIIDTCNLNMSIERLKNCISVTPVSSTNILEMEVVTTDAILSRNISNGIIRYYPDVLERTLKSASLEVLNPPRVAQQADSYHGSLVYPALGFLVAVFFSMMFVYLRLIFHETITDVSELSGKLELGVLATIPKIKLTGKGKKQKKELFITDKTNGFTFTESFKALRTKVEMLAEKKGYKSFVVTSCLEDEGKTTVAVNLAIALAGNGKKVLLIDGDLRKPSLCQYFGLTDSPAALGMRRVLLGAADYMTSIAHVERYGISALLNDTEFLDSSELLSSARIKDMIAKVSGQYDYVIIDSSPASVLTDSVVITSYTDAVLLVLRQDYASVQLAESVVQSVSENKAELIGCIFTMVDDRHFGYPYHGSWNYGKYGKYGKYSKYEKTGEPPKQSADRRRNRSRGSGSDSPG